MVNIYLFIINIYWSSTTGILEGGHDFTHLKYNPAVTVKKGQQITTKRK